MDKTSRKETAAVSAQCRLSTLLHAARFVISLKVAHFARQRNVLRGGSNPLSSSLLFVGLNTRLERDLTPASVPLVVVWMVIARVSQALSEFSQRPSRNKLRSVRCTVITSVADPCRCADCFVAAMTMSYCPIKESLVFQNCSQ